jgi:hypothetical protein
MQMYLVTVHSHATYTVQCTPEAVPTRGGGGQWLEGVKVSSADKMDDKESLVHLTRDK